VSWRLPAIAASGWLLVVLLAATIRLPYRLRRRQRRPLHWPWRPGPGPRRRLARLEPRPRRQPAAEATARERWWRPGAPRWLPLPPGMRLHYWLGYAIAALAVVHGMGSMTRDIVGHAHAAGLKLASFALLAAVGEVGIGLWLRRPGGTRRRQLIRRLHFAVMTLLVALVAVHVALDSWLLGTFHGP
jgi:hypothetical protein